MLIIQDTRYSYPRPNAIGGTITFKFAEPVVVSDIGVMNIDDAEEGRLTFYIKGLGKSTQAYGFNGMGANSVQHMITNKSNVRKVEVRLSGPGAITHLNFCPVNC